MSEKEIDEPIAPGVLAAIIAASVATVIAEPHTIVAVKPVSEGEQVLDPTRSAWTMEGRRGLLANRRVR